MGNVITFENGKRKEEEEKFRCKYSDVLAAVPISAGEKMQYFANIILYFTRKDHLGIIINKVILRQYPLNFRQIVFI